MKTTALLFAISLPLSATMARAADSSDVGPSADAAKATQEEPAPPSSPEIAPPIAPTPAAVPEPRPPVETVMRQEPEPYKGWGRGIRAPIYVSFMFTVGALGEDGDNRLTTRNSKVLEGFGGVFRTGAVLSANHRLGARLQSFVRPTKQIRLEEGSEPLNNKWGSVVFGFIGPEYIYDTGFGLYAAASIGVAGAMSTRHWDDDNNRRHNDDDRDDIERGSAGGAGIVSLGYEWHANKWFAMSAEVYGGFYHGIDDNETSMNNGLFGVAMGVGF